MTTELFNNLPEEVKTNAKEVLKAYDECYIIYQYGKYEVSVGFAITREYANDYKFLGEIKAEQVFTENERKANYKAVFGYEYEGILKGLDTVNA